MRLTPPTFGAAILLGLGTALMVVPLFEQAPGRLRVAAGPYPVQYLAAAIAGDAADIVPLGDEADVVLHTKGSDPAIDAIAREANRARDVAAAIDPRGAVNAPWLYVPNMELMARAVTAELSELRPASTEVFAANRDALLSELFRIQDQYAQGTADCGVRELAVAEPGFEHLAAGYDFQLVTGDGPQLDPILRPPPDGSNYIGAMTANLSALMVTQRCQWPVVLGPGTLATP